MFNLGLPEMLVIGVVALLLFGPRRLPELAKNLGNGIRDFKKALEGEEEQKTAIPQQGTQADSSSSQPTAAPAPKSSDSK